MDVIKKQFPLFPDNSVAKVYKARLERLRLLMRNGIPEDIRWIIEAKVRLEGELPLSMERYMPGMGKSPYAKRRRAKRLSICHKCARENCIGKCRSLGMVSLNREDKIQYIKDGLTKEPLDVTLKSLEAHPSGYVQRELWKLWNQFRDDRIRYSPGNLTLKDPLCQSSKTLL